MANLLLESETEQSIEARIVHVGEQAIPFERFLDMAEGRFVELVQGVIVEKPMIQLDHERCSRWLYSIAWLYAQERRIGRDAEFAHHGQDGNFRRQNARSAFRAAGEYRHRAAESRPRRAGFGDRDRLAH